MAVVVAQLSEQSAPTAEESGSNEVIGNLHLERTLFTVSCWKDTNTQKRRSLVFLKGFETTE